MANQRVTDLDPIVTLPDSGIIHVVDTTNNAQDPAGSSFKITKANLLKENTAAILLNTAKVSITPAQATAITNNTNKVGYTEAAVTANTSVAANTAKIGISTDQAAAIVDNSEKVATATTPFLAKTTLNLLDLPNVTADLIFGNLTNSQNLPSNRGNSYIINKPSTQEGIVTAFSAYATSTGNMTIFVLSKNIDNSFAVISSQVLNLTIIGVQSFTGLNIAIPLNGYVGVQITSSGGNIGYDTATTNISPFWSKTGTLSGANNPVTLISTLNGLSYNFTVRYVVSLSTQKYVTTTSIDPTLVTRVSSLENGTSNVSINKSICLIGDSITDFCDSPSNNGVTYKGYDKYLLEKINFQTVFNQGYSGIQLGQVNGFANTKIAGLPLADVYTIFLGTNDFAFGTQTQIGVINDFINSTGVNTFYGAFRTLLNGIYAKNINADIYICTISNRNSNGLNSWNSTNSNGNTVDQFNTAIIEVSKLMSIGLIDLIKESGINLSTFSNTTYDNLHPNSLGYKGIGKVFIKKLINLY